MTQSSVNISSTGSTAIDGWTESNGGDFRQAVVVADPSNVSAGQAVTSSDAGVGASDYGAIVRPLQQDAAKLRVSAILDSGSISAKSSDAASLLISAKSDSAGQLRISAIQDGAAALNVSAKSDSAALFRVSSALFPDTVGGLTIYDSISVSSAASIKGSAGSIYGYYAWNTDTKPNYIKLYNLSAGLTLGTDATKLVIALPASAAANMTYPNGLAGFTAGIQVAATSAVAENATSLPTTSSVGLQLFYK